MLELGSAAFTHAEENIACLGASGAGKTHVASAIGLAAIYAGARVRFTTAVTLSQELLAAADEHRLPRYPRSSRSADLVLVDELGYLPLGPGAQLLFQFFAERYEAGSVLVTTNLEFSRRSEVFGGATLTAALLDRLIHHSQVLLLDGESYRFRKSAGKLTKPRHKTSSSWSTIWLSRWSTIGLTNTANNDASPQVCTQRNYDRVMGLSWDSTGPRAFLDRVSDDWQCST